MKTTRSIIMKKHCKSIAGTVVFLSLCMAAGAAAGWLLIHMNEYLALAAVLSVAAVCSHFAKGE